MSIWIPKSEYEKMIQYACVKTPKESGGVLMGYLATDESDVVITHVLGPGPNAIHGRLGFVPDYVSDESRVGDYFNQFNGEITYIGDWHSHPNNSSYLSWRDKRALRNIARYEENFIDSPIMLIIGGLGKFDELRGWRVFSEPLFGCFRQWRYRDEEIIYY